MTFLAAIPLRAPDDAVPVWVWLLLVTAATVATVTDLRTMRIPNWLTLPLFAAGLAYGGLAGGWAGLGSSLGGAAIAGGVFIGAYMLAGGGAGDAKLMLGLGAWLGWPPSVVLVLGVTLAGFIWAMAVTAKRGGVRDIPLVILNGLVVSRLGVARVMTGRYQSPTVTEEDQAPRARPKNWFPYAPAILVGTVAAWWYWERFGGIV